MLSQKMGIHEWSYDNEISPEERFKVPWEKAEKTLKSIEVEVELGFDPATAFREAQRGPDADLGVSVRDVITSYSIHYTKLYETP